MYGEGARFRPRAPYRGRGGIEVPQVGYPIVPPGHMPPFGEVRNFQPPFPRRGLCAPRPRGYPRRVYRQAGPSYRPPMGNPAKLPDQAIDDKYHWVRTDQSSATTGNEETNSGKQECQCYRPRSKVYCMQCDHTSSDHRIQRPCPSHPQVLMLMDLTECPNCGASRFWLRENAAE
ncbi:hypothetical protein M513_03993 [Trichuris suis]|uniref:Uncharacterized protein n=1 Tax=Trichuris suis TaxID=68888 RepID=A0A085MCX9_9BILA|nr:hypothetical protein M513_03993 [Trichuris suis]